MYGGGGEYATLSARPRARHGQKKCGEPLAKTLVFVEEMVESSQDVVLSTLSFYSHCTCPVPYKQCFFVGSASQRARCGQAPPRKATGGPPEGGPR